MHFFCVGVWNAHQHEASFSAKSYQVFDSSECQDWLKWYKASKGMILFWPTSSPRQRNLYLIWPWLETNKMERIWSNLYQQICKPKLGEYTDQAKGDCWTSYQQLDISRTKSRGRIKSLLLLLNKRCLPKIGVINYEIVVFHRNTIICF